MFALRLLAPVCAGVLLLASGCGGGSSPAAPGGPTAPAEPGNPGTPGTPGAFVTMSARSGSPQHATVSWLGGTSGSTWRLERRREGGDSNAAYSLVAEVDAAAGLWLDSGLDADTAYAYRLSRSDGSVVASASARTGTEAVLTTAAPQPAGETVSWPVTRTTARVGPADGSVALELPAGSLAQDGNVTLQPITNPVPDGIGLGMSLDLPERPAATLTLALRYDADEDVDEVLQSRLAMRQPDGSWWLLPLAAHDRTQRVLRVNVPASLWVQAPTATAQAVRPAAGATPRAAVGGVRGIFVRVKAHKLVPASASVRVLGSQRFVPVSIYAVPSDHEGCDDSGSDADGQLCIPMPILRDVTVPILNSKPGYQRQWTLQGSPAADPAFGSLATQSSSGVVYTAPGVVPATNPVQLRFESTNTRTGQRLVLTANVRITEDAWVGSMDAYIGDLGQGHVFRLETRWSLDVARSTATRRVYIPAGTADHLYTVIDPICTHTVAPLRLSLAQAQTLGQLVVDESVSPPRYTLDLATRWDSTITVSCPPGTAKAPYPGGHIWSAQGVVSGGRIEGSDRELGDRNWSLGRSE